MAGVLPALPSMTTSGDEPGLGAAWVLVLLIAFPCSEFSLCCSPSCLGLKRCTL